MNNKVVLIGCGNVGSSYAYAIINQRTKVSELVIIDTNKDKAMGDVMDLNHSLAFAPSKLKIRVGDYDDVRNAKIVCITAGLNQKPGETRLDLISKNKEIIKDITNKVMDNGFDGVFLIATNPLDIMTSLVYKYAKLKNPDFKTNQVIGSGTSLDTSRLRYLIGNKLKINPNNVHAYVIGEHGDSEFVPWSNATVGLNPISNYLKDEELTEIYLDVRDSAYKIIERKGFTNFGIGVCLVKITNAILGDENTIITVSCYDDKYDVFISEPAIINKDGVREKIRLNLTSEEQDLFLASIDILKKEYE